MSVHLHYPESVEIDEILEVIVINEVTFTRAYSVGFFPQGTKLLC